MEQQERSMALLQILTARRSIRRFGERALTEAERSVLERAVLLAPTSRDLQPCQFYFVTNLELIRALAEVKDSGTRPLLTAPLAVVIAADPEKCDVWIEDSALAAYTLLLTAEALGLGATWVQIRKRGSGKEDAEENVKDLLRLPRELRVLAIVCIGEKAETKMPRAEETLHREKIHELARTEEKPKKVEA